MNRPPILRGRAGLLEWPWRLCWALRCRENALLAVLGLALNLVLLLGLLRGL